MGSLPFQITQCAPGSPLSCASHTERWQEPTEEDACLLCKILMLLEGRSGIGLIHSSPSLHAHICQNLSILTSVIPFELHRNPLSERSRSCPHCTNEEVSARWSELSKVTQLCLTATQISLLSDKPVILPNPEDKFLS